MSSIFGQPVEIMDFSEEKNLNAVLNQIFT